MITDQYKTRLTELLKYLDNIKQQLDELDKTYKTIESKTEYLTKNSGPVFKVINNHLNALWDIASPYVGDAAVHTAYKDYTREQLKPYFYYAPLNKRIHDKPLGYDGDYMVVNYFYQNNYPGESLYQMLINGYTISIPVTQAHINRRRYFNEYIDRLIAGGVQELKILSLGCGPAVEVVDLLKKQINCQIYLNDMEVEALGFVRQNLAPYMHDKARVEYINNNILLFIKNLKKYNLSDIDLVYSFGLFDYLNDKAARLLIKMMQPYLSKNGLFVITNVAKDIPNRANIEFLCNWKLIYRNQSDMQNLVVDMGYSGSKVFKDQTTGCNLYLELSK